MLQREPGRSGAQRGRKSRTCPLPSGPAGRENGCGARRLLEPRLRVGRKPGIVRPPPRGRSLHGSRAGRGLRAGPGALGGRRRRWRSASWQSSARVRLRESCFPVPRAPWLARLRASAHPSASPAAHADAGGARRGPSANSGGAGNVAAERSGAARVPTSTGLVRTPCSFETRRSGAKLSPGDVCLGKKYKYHRLTFV